MDTCGVCGERLAGPMSCPRCEHDPATPLLDLAHDRPHTAPVTPTVARGAAHRRRSRWSVRLAATALGALAVGIALAVLVRGDEAPAVAPDAGSETDEAASPPGASPPGDPAVPSGSAADSALPAVAVAGADPGVFTVAGDLPAELVGLRLAVRAGDRVVVATLGDGTARAVPSDYPWSPLRAGGFALGPGDTLVTVDDDRAVLSRTGSGERFDLGPAVDVLSVSGSDTVWLLDDDQSGVAPPTVRAVAATAPDAGVSAGPFTFGARIFPARAVPSGFVAVSVWAGTYLWDGVAWDAVHDGRALAWHGDLVVVEECDGDLCGVFRLDMATGQRVVASGVLAEIAAAGTRMWLEPSGASVVFAAPDGGVARAGVVTGSVSTLSSWGGPGSRLLGLSPGGRWLFGFDGVDEVVAFDLTGGVKGVVSVLTGVTAEVDLATLRVAG